LAKKIIKGVLSPPQLRKLENPNGEEWPKIGPQENNSLSLGNIICPLPYYTNNLSTIFSHKKYVVKVKYNLST